MSEVAGRLSVQEGAFFLTRRAAAAASCWRASPACRPATSWCSARAPSASTPRAWRWAWAPTSRSSTSTSIACARWTTSSTAASSRSCPTASTSPGAVRGPISLVGAVLVTGARAPILVTEEMVSLMKEGSVIVDVAVDQGGCVETIHPTTLATRPTSSPASSTTASPTCRRGAAHVHLRAHQRHPALRAGAGRQGPGRGGAGQRPLAKGVNIWGGRVVHPAVADALGEPATPLQTLVERS